MLGGHMPLLDAYREISRLVGGNAEPLKSVLLVEEYRRYFRPDRVRIVLLAESHVFTSDENRNVMVPSIDGLPGYPRQYARFVYCLGCGERDLTNDPRHPEGDGTPQFWKVLYACENRVETLEDFTPILRPTPFPQRLQNKIRLLKNLRAKGIWLVDASIVAVYGRGVNISRRNKAEVIRRSWDSYTKQVVKSSNPERVICVGMGVAEVVESDLRALFPARYEVLPQPNARLSTKKHIANFQQCHEICSSKI
jgi:hypothetical protein